MEEDTTSNFSSIADAPYHLRKQYTHLNEVFSSHPTEFPQRGPPESDSDAVIKALKALQCKIQHLESEKVHTADRLQRLARETEQSVLERQSQLQDAPAISTSLTQDQENLKTRLESIDTQFSLQAKQLEQIRERLLQTETARLKMPSQYRQKEGPFMDQNDDETKVKMKQLEDEQARLLSVHSHTERKLKNIESQLIQEQQHRKQLLDNAAKLQTASEVERALLQASKSQRRTSHKRNKASQSLTCKCGAQKAGLSALCRCKPVPGVHYRMDMRDVPFVVGTSTTPSHSIGANYQCVLSMMKSHNPLLCGAAAACGAKHSSKAKTGNKKTSILLTDLKVLLNGLEEEFGQLTFEHQALAREIEEHTSSQTAVSIKDLEDQLEQVVKHLESKAKQITTVKKQIRAHKQVHKPLTVLKPTVSERTPKIGHSQCSVSSSEKTSLNFLKKMKSLQNTLQSDDLKWN